MANASLLTTWGNPIPGQWESPNPSASCIASSATRQLLAATATDAGLRQAWILGDWAAVTAGEKMLTRALVTSQKAPFGAGVVAGVPTGFAGGPTPVILGNGKFNSGAKFGSVLGKFAKTALEFLF